MRILKTVYNSAMDAIGMLGVVLILAIAVPVGVAINRGFRADVVRIIKRWVGHTRDAFLIVAALPIIAARVLFKREPSPEYWTKERKRLDDECPPNWG